MSDQAAEGLPRDDIRLSTADRQDLNEALAHVFSDQRAVRAILRRTAFPPGLVPGFDGSPAADVWGEILFELENGRIQAGIFQLVTAALHLYPHQPVFQRLARKHQITGPEPGMVGSAPIPPSTTPSTPLSTPPSSGVSRVLVVSASPTATTPIRAETAAARIRPERDAKAIIDAANRGHLHVEHCPAASALDLRRILEFRPDILHLACHGDGEHLVFEDIYGEEDQVPARDIADTLRLYRQVAGIRLRGVVLGSCHSAEIAALFLGPADRVVAHRGRLDDACGTVFAGQLYETLKLVPDLGGAARLAAQHSLLADQTCDSVVTDLVVLPDGD